MNMIHVQTKLVCSSSLPFLVLITARVRSTTGRYCFHRCLSVNICVCVCGGGVPRPMSGWVGVPQPGLEGRGYLGYPQPGVHGGGGGYLGYPPGLDGGGYLGYLLARSGWPGLDGEGYPGYPPGQVCMVGGGVPPPLDRAS